MITGVALAFALCALQAGSHPLEGVWKITYPWHIEIENGAVRPVMESAELTVEVRGDSLLATVVTTSAGEFSPRRPFRLAAELGGAEAVFVMRDPVTFNVGGAERQAVAVSTWTFQAEGDQLKGSLERRLEGINQGHGKLPIQGNRLR